MNMGSLKAELTFPPRFSLDPDPRDERDPQDGPAGGSGDDLLYPNTSDGELDETTMILGTTPQACFKPKCWSLCLIKLRRTQSPVWTPLPLVACGLP